MGFGNLKKNQPTGGAGGGAVGPVYVANVGMNYGCTEDNPAGTRLEAGQIVPAAVIQASQWLLEQNLVRLQSQEEAA